jgi:hypothetical protein
MHRRPYRLSTAAQEVRFNRQGDVSFSELHWFTPALPPDGHDNATNSQGERPASGSDVITTLNLPLLGTLAMAEKLVGRFKALAELAVKEFFERRQDHMFEGLFMRR